MKTQSKPDRVDDLILQLFLRRPFADFMDIAVIGTLLTVQGIKSAPTEIRQSMLEGLVNVIREQVEPK